MPITATAQVCWAGCSSTQSCLSGRLSTETLLNTFRLELFRHIHALQQPVSHRCAHIHTETHKYGCTQVVLQGNTATCERAVVCRRGGCLGEWFEFSITSNCRKRRKVNSLHFTSQIVLLYLCIMHAHINP